MSESTGLASFEARFPSGIWACDFEFNGGAGERPDPVCMVARNLASDQTIRLWRDELYALDSAPFPTGPDALFVAFYASAELGCFLALGWQLPTNTLDLFVEQRWLTNGLPTAGRSLLSALHYYGIAAMGAEEKEDLRRLILNQNSWSGAERVAIFDYCAGDVCALGPLLDAMAFRIDLRRALLRGRYMGAVARMEWNGVPIDTGTLARLTQYWSLITPTLIAEVDSGFGVFDGTIFRAHKFEKYIESEGIGWPRSASGKLFPLRTDADVVRWPDRYMDERGQPMWDTVMRLLDQLEREAA